MSKYWNVPGNDPLPDVAELYYGLFEEIHNSIPEEIWDADKCKGLEGGRYWSGVSVYHIGHLGPRDIHLYFNRNKDGQCIIKLRTIGGSYEKIFWECPFKNQFSYTIPNKTLMNRDFAKEVLTIFAYGQRGYKNALKEVIEKYGGKEFKNV